MNNIGNFINGKCEKGISKEFGIVFDPSTGEEKSQVVFSNSEDFRNVIQSSKKKFC